MYCAMSERYSVYRTAVIVMTLQGVSDGSCYAVV